jgi:hypothetical protein
VSTDPDQRATAPAVGPAGAGAATPAGGPAGAGAATPAGVGPDPASFLSGEHGRVVGPRLTVKRTLAEIGCGAARALALTGVRLERLAAAQEARDVLVLSIYRPGSRLPGAARRLSSHRHRVRFALGSIAEADPALAAQTVATGLAGGKFENLNRVLALAPPAIEHDWVIVCDDDIDLPRRFLDRFLALCEHLELDLAQPAQTMRSHAAWRVTRRRPFSLARRTNYVEIGPLTLFSRRAASELIPFPELRFGWGLDNHWAALARQRGWRLGVIDSLPVRHESQPVATAYTHAEAIAEARRFLEGLPYVRTEEAQRTLATVRRLHS